MERTTWTMAALLVALAMASCGGGGAADPGAGEDAPDAVQPADLPADEGPGDPGDRDLAGDPAPDPGPAPDDGPGDPGPADPGSADVVADLPADLPPVDPGAPDPGPGDPGSPDPGSPADEGPGDPGAPDPGAVDPGPPLPGTVQARPAAPEDCVASYLINASPAAWNLFGGDSLPLGRHFDLDHVAYHSAIRFPGLAVPAGATIRSATLSFLPANEVDSSNILWLTLAAEAVADSPPLSLTDYDAGRPDQRLRTDARVDQWVVRCNADCTDLTEYDCPQRKRDCWDRTVRYACPKDLKALVQEVVDLPGWAPGNALTIFLDVNVPRDYVDRDTGARHVVGVDPARDADTRPMLEVAWD